MKRSNCWVLPIVFVIGCTNPGSQPDGGDDAGSQPDSGEVGDMAVAPDLARHVFGKPEVIADNLPNPQAIAVDDDSVYFSEYLPNKILKVAKAGGTPVQLAGDTDVYAPNEIAIDGSNVYWVNTGRTAPVSKVAKAGGAVTILAPKQTFPTAIAIDSTNVYWANYGDATHPGEIDRVAIGGGSAVPLAIASDYPSHVAVGGGQAFFVDGNALLQVSTSGGTARNVATGSRGFGPIHTDSQYVYWVGFTAADGSVYRRPLAGGVTEKLATAAAITDFIVDDSFVYVSDSMADTITAMPIAGGAAVVIAHDQVNPGAFALDATYLYWANEGSTGTINNIPTDGAIMRLKR